MAKSQRINKGNLSDFRIGFWDIESSGLRATFGGMYCATVKELKGACKTFRVDESPNYKKYPWDDKWLCKKLRDELESYQVVVGYNTVGAYRKGFDLPFLNSRLVRHKERILSPEVKHVDLYNVTRMKLQLHSDRLESLLEHLKAKTRKTPLVPEDWRKAGAGDKTSMERIVKHNVHDVIVLEEAFLRLIPFLDVQFRLVR